MIVIFIILWYLVGLWACLSTRALSRWLEESEGPFTVGHLIILLAASCFGPVIICIMMIVAVVAVVEISQISINFNKPLFKKDRDDD